MCKFDILGLSKTSHRPDTESSELKPILSGGEVSVDTLTTEKSVLSGRNSSDEAGVLRKSSRVFKMIKCEIKENIGKPINAYGLVALMPTKGQENIKDLLTTLKNDVGDGLWVMPPNALHITLCEIVQAKKYSKDADDLFNAHEESYINEPAKILSSQKPINVKFNEIFVSPQAIIVKGQDDGSFTRIRSQLMKKIVLPEGTALPPQIIHSSIARYTKELPLEDVRNAVSRYSINFEVTIREFHLIHNMVSPLLGYELLKSYPLVG